MLVMILADGETFTELSGCTIAEIPDDCDNPKGMGYRVLVQFGSTRENDIILYNHRHSRAVTVFTRELAKGT